jgi:hypothetical protein
MTVPVSMISQRVLNFASHERLLIGASVFRIVAGLTILYQYLMNYHQRHYLYGPDAIWPYATFLENLVETHSFSLYAISSSSPVFELVFHLGLLVTVFWTIGWHTQLMTLLTYIFVWSLHERNPLLWDGGDNVLQIVLVYAVFANLGAYFSLDTDRLRLERESGGIRSHALAILHNAALLAFAIQLCLVYGTAGLYKVQGKMWQSGTALYYIMRVAEFTWPGYSEYVYQDVFLVTALSYTTVVFQVSFPFLFFLQLLHPPANPARRTQLPPRDWALHGAGHLLRFHDEYRIGLSLGWRLSDDRELVHPPGPPSRALGHPKTPCAARKPYPGSAARAPLL